jgi:putative addiction module killer protein
MSLVGDIIVYEVRQTELFAAWFHGLRDKRAKARILTRIDRLSLGNPGDVRPIGEGVSELRIDYGPGYRVYFVRRAATVVLLLAGGDKQTQSQDIRIALKTARSL